MGMYSYVCKGCGQELVEEELVRLNGCTGEYDGYGRAGGFSSHGEQCVAWHELCFQQASASQKLDRKPSRSARNQGFGPRHLEFIRGYDPKAKTVYYAQIGFVPSDLKDSEQFRSVELILTDRGWVDAAIWEALSRTEEVSLEGDISEEGKRSLPKGFEDIGDPYMIRKAHDTLDGAREAAEEYVKAWKGSSSFSEEYDLYVMAKQDLPSESSRRPCIYGMVYHFERNEKVEFKDEKFIDTGVFEEKTYRIGQRIPINPCEVERFILEQIAEIGHQLKGIVEELNRMEEIIKARQASKKKD